MYGLKITLAYSSNVLVVPGFIICTIAAPSRMTLVTTGASDLALESSSMQFRHFGQFPLRQALPFPSCQALSGHPCFLLQMDFQVPQAQPQVRSHLSHMPSGLQLFGHGAVCQFASSCIAVHRYQMDISIISNGIALPYIEDPNLEQYLPTIPSQITSFNFTWTSAGRLYYYDFDRLRSLNQEVLKNPVISIERKGKVPSKTRVIIRGAFPGNYNENDEIYFEFSVFQIFFVCSANRSGVAFFEVGLIIQNAIGKNLPGTPIRLRLKKELTILLTGPDPECDLKCENKGHCNKKKICECPKGFIGKYCNTALCYPQCMNGGTCISPGVCKCADGYQGTHCEGGNAHSKNFITYFSSCIQVFAILQFSVI
ncbi:Protein shifted [Nymphon striatum]|nr:Protein shifted [Nymphon striatum]